ncbi:MAG: hypothetical protein PHR16_14215 [Methylovulum sp.]|nr:hypothetical protein [Methylovulum sp.]
MNTLKMIGFSHIEKIRFSAILTLAESRLKQKWKTTEHIPADFYLIKECLIPQMDEHEMLKHLPRQQCVFIRRTPDDPSVEEHQFYWGKEDNPSLQYLTEFFNKLGDNDNTPPPPADSQPIPIPETCFFNPQQGFLGHLLAPATTPLTFKLTNQHAGIVLLVDTEQNSYYSNSSLEQLEPYFFATTELQVANISAQQLQAASASQALKERPLTHLLWFTAFTCSQGKPIQGYQQSDIVHLKRWPDINLPGCKRLIKLAAYMHSNAVDLATAQANTGAPIEQIYNFYNACKVIGLIAHSEHTDVHEKTINDEQKQLLEKIGKRFNQTLQLPD